jgi:hypothetical protein
MSGLPKSGHDWAIYEHTPELPLADLGRSAGQAPLHRLHAAGIAAGGDDAEFGARLFEALCVGEGDRLHKWKMARVGDIVLIDQPADDTGPSKIKDGGAPQIFAD